MPHDGLFSVDGEVLLEHLGQFDGDVRKHLVVGLPSLLGGVDVKAGAGAKIPSVLLALNVAATCGQSQIIDVLGFMEMKNERGLVSGHTMMTPRAAAVSWAPAFCTKLSSLHVRPDSQ
jgi:hypothetical protein